MKYFQTRSSACELHLRNNAGSDNVCRPKQLTWFFVSCIAEPASRWAIRHVHSYKLEKCSRLEPVAFALSVLMLDWIEIGCIAACSAERFG